MTFVATDTQCAESHTWLTPLPLVRALGEFDLDPCAAHNHPTAKRLIILPEDGLAADWNGRVWLNPPYGKHAEQWLDKLDRHGDGIALVFNRLETKWMKRFLRNGFFCLSGRVTFLSSRDGFKGNAGTGSILIPFGRKNVGSILMSNLEGEWFQ